jgi:hypothetical protein
VRIWTAQRTYITALRHSGKFTETRSGFYGTTEWAELHLGLTISRRSRARPMPQKWPPAIDMDQPKVRAARDAPHRSGPLRCGSRRLRRGLETASGTRLGLTRVRIDPSQASVSATLIGRFNGRVIRNVSCSHRPRDFPLAATVGLPGPLSAPHICGDDEIHGANPQQYGQVRCPRSRSRSAASEGLAAQPVPRAATASKPQPTPTNARPRRGAQHYGLRPRESDTCRNTSACTDRTGSLW